METAAHLNLKRMALAFLRQRGCQAAATEVRCPISRYRIDVAGYLEGVGNAGEVVSGQWPVVSRPLFTDNRQLTTAQPRTIVIECKQSREDFLRDCEEIEPLLQLRADYEAMRQSIEENRIKRLEPQLRHNGTSLFAELDDWHFEGSQLPGYRRVLRELRRIDQKLHGETKFFLMAKYHLADELFLAAPCGMIRPREVPAGWGLLECVPQVLAEGAATSADHSAFNIRIEAAANRTRPAHRMRMLRNIAVAASRHVWAGMNHEICNGKGMEPRMDTESKHLNV